MGRSRSTCAWRGCTTCVKLCLLGNKTPSGETVLVYCCVLTHGSHTVVLRSLPSAYTLSLVTQRDWVPLHPCFVPALRLHRLQEAH